MNQLKQMFGLPATISHTARSLSLSRSAGSNGRDSGNILAGTRTADHSPELRLCEKSYARLIAEHSRAIDARRNARTKGNCDLTGRCLNTGFFSKTPFKRLAGASSFVKVKNGANKNSARLSTTNTSGPPITTAKTINSGGKSHGSFDETEILEQVTEQAQWLDRLVEAHRTKRSARNDALAKSDETIHVRPLAPWAVNTVHGEDTSDTMNLPGKGSVVPDEIPTMDVKDNEGDAKNISVTVKPRETSGAPGNDTNATDIGDNATFLVTVTEESNLSANTQSSPLRHIDLRINGKPAMDTDTVIKKVEKLDVVSLADKIEIKIPILADTRGNIAGQSRVSNSTINLCISSLVKRPSEANSGKKVKVHDSRDAGPGDSRPSSAHPSAFYVTKANSARKVSRCKVVPWWTTEKSFRRSEIGPARSSGSASAFKEAKTLPVSDVAARGSNQQAEQGDVKNVAFKDAEMKIKTAVAKPSSPRRRMRTRRRATTAISKIIENELRKRSEESQESVQRYVHPGATKSAAKHETKVKTATNGPKKGTTVAITDGTIEVRNDRTITPALDKIPAKMPTPVNTGGNGSPSGPKSLNGLATTKKNNKVTNVSPPKMPQAPKADDSALTKLPQKLDSRAETEENPRLFKTHRDSKRSSDVRAIAESVNRTNTNHGKSAREDDKMANNSDEKIVNLKRTPIVIKPIEKKKDGTLIDYGLTVPTRKKSERKLLASRSTTGANGKKSLAKEEAPIVATIKEVIHRRDKELRSSSINRGIVYPARFKLNGPEKNGQNRQHTANQKHHPCWSKKTAQQLKTDDPKNSKINKVPTNGEKNPSNSSESPEKKLLYSVWLRRSKDPDGNDPQSSKGPRDS